MSKGEEEGEEEEEDQKRERRRKDKKKNQRRWACSARSLGKGVLTSGSARGSIRQRASRGASNRIQGISKICQDDGLRAGRSLGLSLSWSPNRLLSSLTHHVHQKLPEHLRS